MGTRRFTPEEEPEVIRRYQSGEGIVALSRVYKCSHKTIYGVLRRWGRRTNNPQSDAYEFTNDEIKNIIFLWESDLPVTAIAKEMGAKGPEVSVCLADHGYDVHLRYSYNGERVNGARGWGNGRWPNKEGYIIVPIYPDDPMYCMTRTSGRANTVAEHRLLMARSIGRPLLDSETVHHIDGNGFNNDISNLQLRQGHHGTGVVMTCLDCGSHNIQSIPIADPRDIDGND